MKEDSPITITLVGTSEALRYLTSLRKNLQPTRLTALWEEVTDLVRQEAEDKAPNWKGGLSAGIASAVSIDPKASDIIGIVYSDTFYAPYQELGRDPFFPNLDAITEWATDKGLSPYLVAKIISRRGLKPKEFFKGALEEHEDEVIKLIGGGVVQIFEMGAETLNGGV